MKIFCSVSGWFLLGCTYAFLAGFYLPHESKVETANEPLAGECCCHKQKPLVIQNGCEVKLCEPCRGCVDCKCGANCGCLSCGDKNCVPEKAYKVIR